MSEARDALRIASEDDAFALLAMALDGKLPDPDPLSIDFRGWPTVSVHLPNTPIDASISPTMMGAFIELQTAVYRAYLLLTSDTGDLRNLNRVEREQLEFRVKVSPGSSDYMAELAKCLESLGASMVAKMDPVDLLIAVLGVALIVCGSVAWKAWLSSRVEQRKAELDRDERVGWLEAQQKSLEHDTERFNRLLDAIKRQPVLGDVEAATETARQQIVRAIGAEHGGRAQGIELEPEFASEVVSQARQQGTPTTFTKVYRVAKVDTTVPDGFRVTLTDVENGKEVTASLQDALVSEDHRVLIREAEWSKRPIRVRLSARLLRARYVDAVVLSVQPLADLATPQLEVPETGPG